MVEAHGPGDPVDLAAALAEGRVLAPINHVDPAPLWLTGTGLAHLGSADARDAMHKAVATATSDSMRMFRDGIAGGEKASHFGPTPPINGVMGFRAPTLGIREVRIADRVIRTNDRRALRFGRRAMCD